MSALPPPPYPGIFPFFTLPLEIPFFFPCHPQLHPLKFKKIVLHPFGNCKAKNRDPWPWNFYLIFYWPLPGNSTLLLVNSKKFAGNFRSSTPCFPLFVFFLEQAIGSCGFDMMLSSITVDSVCMTLTGQQMSCSVYTFPLMENDARAKTFWLPTCSTRLQVRDTRDSTL